MFPCVPGQTASPTTEIDNVGSGTMAERVDQFERQVILDEIKRQDHHITNAAKVLGLERSHLYKKCQQPGIDLQEMRK